MKIHQLPTAIDTSASAPARSAAAVDESARPAAAIAPYHELRMGTSSRAGIATAVPAARRGLRAGAAAERAIRSSARGIARRSVKSLPPRAAPIGRTGAACRLLD